MDTAPFPSPDAKIAALRSLLAERDAELAERDALPLNFRLEIGARPISQFGHRR